MVHVALEDDLFSALHARQDKGLAIIVSVGSHAQKNFLGVRFLLEGIVETEDGISGGSSQS